MSVASSATVTPGTWGESAASDQECGAHIPMILPPSSLSTPPLSSHSSSSGVFSSGSLLPLSGSGGEDSPNSISYEEEESSCSSSLVANQQRLDLNWQQRDQRLLDLTDATGYQIIQRNGQRIYGGPPPNWTGPPPPQGSEVFVGKVPRDLIEADIVPIFERIGVIYELRLMMDFSGSNRGFFFVRYTCQEDAKRAAKTLNNYEIQPGKHLGVVHSKDNRKLWISGIPNNHTPEEIKKEMSELTAGVKDVILYASRTDKSRTRSYAFVEYESHRAAALARRTLVPRKIYLGGQEVHRVDWAEPEPEVDCEVMRKVKVLFVRNLMPETTEQQIHNMFATLASMGGRFQPDEVERVKKSQDFGFVHFRTREAAEEALRHCDHVMIDNALLSVSWSKPVQNSDKGLFQAGRAASRQPSSDYAKYEPRSPYLAQMFGSGRSKSQNNFAGLMQPHKARPPMLLPPNVNHSPLRQLSKKITEAGPPFCAARGLYPHQAISPTPPAPRIMAPLNLPFVPQQQPPPQSTHSYVLPSLSCGQAMLSGEAPYPTNGSVGGIALTNGGGSLNGVGYSRMTPYFRGSYWNSGGFPPQGQGIQNGFNGQYLSSLANVSYAMPQLASKPTNHFYDSFNLMNGGAGTDLNNTTHANYKEVDPPESAEIVSVDEE